jgi:hypothetical protein
MYHSPDSSAKNDSVKQGSGKHTPFMTSTAKKSKKAGLSALLFCLQLRANV